MHPIVSGGLAGAFATLPMTAAMRRLHERLPPGERHPLPPRELVEAAGSGLPAALTGRDATMLAHFGYGALAGALFAGLFRSRSLPAGVGFGLAVWGASYLGWIPGACRVAAERADAGRARGLGRRAGARRPRTGGGGGRGLRAGAAPGHQRFRAGTAGASARLAARNVTRSHR